MSRRVIYFFGVLIILVFGAWYFFQSDGGENEFSERVKISLRAVGDELLRSDQDTTSLVLPVIALEKSKYKLSFQKHLSLDPSSLVMQMETSFKKANLSQKYRVEVIQCADGEVAYSYQMNTGQESTIVPCGGRSLPENCYSIQVRFTDRPTSFFSSQTFIYGLTLLALLLLATLLFQKKPLNKKQDQDNYTSIGSFQFYPEQHKLIKKAVEIQLSKKECELLAIFVAHPNEIIKRDELTKKVWEDNGVIVGRSLDTYISKLRKKLKDDDTVKLTNVHGVGYKLELLK